MGKQDIVVIGLAVMGKNLALNIESKGYSVSVYNRSREKDRRDDGGGKGQRIHGTYSLEEFVDSLQFSEKDHHNGQSGKACG